MVEKKTAKETKGAKSGGQKPKLAPETVRQIDSMRSRIYETFGKVCVALIALPRYRHMPLGDLQSTVLEPLMRDRVVIASRKTENDSPSLDSLSGIAIWASVSEEVDARIRDQIRAGVFPVRLQPAEWTSGSINWLLDVIAPNKQLAAAVVANFRQVSQQGDLRIHPIVSRLIDVETLKKMGARPLGQDEAAEPVETT